MSKPKLSPKQEAQQALSKGDLKKALEDFQKHCAQEPEDLRSWLKVAELLDRLGQKREALQAYRNVAEAYAQDGFLLQAISVTKIILRINPTAKDLHDRLAQLYLEKRKETKPVRSLPPIPLFSELNEQELQTLLRDVEMKTFSKGEPICREKEAGDSLFVIHRGEVAVIKETPSGRVVEMRRLKDGDFFGEFGFFMDHRRHATVRAVTECEILEISRDDLNRIIKVYPRVSEVLNHLFRHRVLDIFLALSPLFSSLAATERDEIIKYFRIHKFSEGAIIFQEGDPPTSFYMVKSGEVEIFTKPREGKKVVVATLRSGNFFGEIGIFFNKPRTASARTTRSAELLELKREDLDVCLLQFPALQATMKESSLRRLAQLKEICSQAEVEKVREAMV